MVIATVGAGGKTTICTHIGKSLAEVGRRALFTTTTKILRPNDDTLYVGASAAIRAEAAFMVAGHSWLPGGKLKGYTPTDIAALAGSGPFDDIIVEADGAARKPVKAPGDSEPVYPAAADLIIGVIGLDCLGKPVSAEWVHRPERFCAVTGAFPGDAIAAHHLVRLIAHPEGLFHHAPADVPRIVFLNKWDATNAATQMQARQIVSQSPDTVMLTGYDQDWFGVLYRRYWEGETDAH